MFARVLAAGVPFGWVAGDTVYGNDRRLRRWLEERGLPYVLAVKSNEPLWVDTEGGAAVGPADTGGGLAAADRGRGQQGARLYDWGRASARSWSEPDQSHWLLVRRNIADLGGQTYYDCFAPANADLAELVRVDGHRWIIEDAFKEAKQEVGLDGYEVRRWTGWYRHIALALLVHAFLAVCRMYVNADDAKGGAALTTGLIQLTVPEVRRLLRCCSDGLGSALTLPLAGRGGDEDIKPKPDGPITNDDCKTPPSICGCNIRKPPPARLGVLGNRGPMGTGTVFQGTAGRR